MRNVLAAVTAWVPKHLRHIAIAVAVLGILGGLVARGASSDACGFGKAYSYTQITYGGSTIRTAVATTPEQRQLGLGKRDCMPHNQAMLFIFDQPGMYGFWMKDMRFDIDMLWLDASKRVITIKQGVSPTTYPASFYPDRPALYVLELPSGMATHYGLRAGSQLNW